MFLLFKITKHHSGSILHSMQEDLDSTHSITMIRNKIKFSISIYPDFEINRRDVF